MGHSRVSFCLAYSSALIYGPCIAQVVSCLLISMGTICYFFLVQLIYYFIIITNYYQE